MQVHLYQIITRRLLLFFLCNVLFFSFARAQASYEQAGVLYQDGNVTVTLQYRMADCSTNRLSRYRYVITGAPSRSDVYLNWKVDYYNCDNSITTQTNSYNLRSFVQSDQPQVIDDMDWSFSASRLYHPFYDVRTSVNRDNSLPVKRPLPVSKKATSISGDRTIDYGDHVTLKQEGGALGENAQWHWYTSSCGTNQVGEGESISVTPLQTTQYFVRAEGPKGTTECVSANIVVNTKSKAADMILGSTFFCKGNSGSSISVSGGKLGKAAHWVWYVDSAGGRAIGTGTQLQISPQTTTRYVVRAEGADNITESRSITIKIVDERSTDATGISGLQNVCEGNPVELKVVGGKLSADAQWYWYQDNVGKSGFIGNGSQLTVKPVRNTVYYVRAEGVCNTTTEQSQRVNVMQASKAAYSVRASATSVYRGTKVSLTVQGGTLGENSTWKWYTKDCFKGKPVGTGESITVRAHKSATYYVRAENQCSVTSCVSRQVEVNRKFVFINFGLVPSFRTPNVTGFTDVVKSGFTKATNQGTFGFTIGKVKRNGWYLRGKYSINTKKPQYNTSDDKTVSDFSSSSNYYAYNGEVQDSRISGTAGLIYALSKNTFLVNIGVGYGERNLSWGITEYAYQSGTEQKKSWAKSSNYSFKGVELELGLMIKLPVFNIMIGANDIYPTSSNSDGQAGSKKQYIDAYAGIGFNF